MGRRKSVDRQFVLQVAEDIVNQRGAAALTIDAVATSAGITKGGVQSCFGTKEALIIAMQQRSAASYERRLLELVGETDSPIKRILAHVEITQDDDEKSQRRAASLLAALLQTPDHLGGARAWYEHRFSGLDLTTKDAKNARIAFLATEGLFFLKFFNLMDIDEAEWRSVLSDIRALFD